MDHERSGTSGSAGTKFRDLLFGFVAGALSVLSFHQGMLALLQALEVTPCAPYPLAAGGQPSATLTAVLVNADWGLGTALLPASLRTRRMSMSTPQVRA